MGAFVGAEEEKQVRKDTWISEWKEEQETASLTFMGLSI